METNLTNKKPYNVLLLLAGISFSLFALGKLITKIITLIPYISPKYGLPQNAIIIQILLSIIPILLLVVSLVFCVFMFIGKPKIIFSLYYIVIILFYLYHAITSVISLVSYISQFIDSLDYRPYMAGTLGYFTIYNLFLLISALAIIAGFVIAFITSLVSIIKKRSVKIWFIPGIIVIIGFIADAIAHIISLFSKPIIQIIASILNTRSIVNINMDFSSVLVVLIGILTTLFLVLGTFFLGKGTNK